MEEKQKTKGVVGLFAAVLGKNQPNPEEPTGQMPEEMEPSADSHPKQPTQSVLDSGALDLPEEGFVQHLWQYWQNSDPENTAPLDLKLKDMVDGRLVPLLPMELELERLKLTLWLELQAKKRWEAVDKATEEAPVRTEPAQCWLHMAENGMMVWGVLIPPLGEGQPLSVEEAFEALRTKQVVSGVDTEAVAALVEQKNYFKLIPMAWGTAPIPGVDGCIIEHYPRQHERDVEMDENGNVDYRSRRYFQGIQKGDIICDIIPPREGIPGIRVDGKLVSPPTVKPAEVPGGINTAISEDGLHLIATMDGCLEYKNSAFLVKPLLEIPGDVDYSTGNIDFLGDVHIAGDVREKFSVRATGTVTIDGLVEAATIDADGSIVVAKGVLGDNRALLKSKKTVRAKYLENCVVYSGECTYADCIIGSQIYSDQRISVLTGRGTIIGGCLTAAGQIEATVIGSERDRRTEIILGALPYVQEERRDNAKELEEIAKEEQQLALNLSFLEEHQDNEENAKRLAKLRLRKSVLSLKSSRLQKRQEELDAMVVDVNQCRLKCKTVYPTTKVTIGSASRNIDHVWKNCTAMYDAEEHEIRIF